MVQALFAFGLLFAGVVLLTLYYDFTYVDLGSLLFLLALLCCIFIAKNTYDDALLGTVTGGSSKNTDSEFALSSDQLYIKLFEKSPVPYIIIDLNGHIKTVNTAAIRLLGMRQEKLEGINAFNLLSYDKEDHFDFMIEKYRSGVPISDEMVRIKRSNHREAWALLSLSRCTSTIGQELGLLTLVDITKQKKAEDAKSEFVSLASHQLRTPIAGMKWSAELLQMDGGSKLTKRQQKYIERLLISVERMGRLIDDFLRVSRFELGTFQPDYKSVELNQLVEEVLAEQSSRIKQKHLQVKTFFDSSVDKLRTDPNLIRMIVTNLTSNAIKYTKNEGTIHIGFGRKDDRVLITVADNGMGIPPEEQDGIFSKLFRGSNAVRNVPDGTGLGLYIVREAVAVLKGQITFTSTENLGTTFEVQLPLDQPIADEKSAEEKKES